MQIQTLKKRKKKALEDWLRTLCSFSDTSRSCVPYLGAYNSWTVFTNQLLFPCLGWKNNFGKYFLDL